MNEYCCEEHQSENLQNFKINYEFFNIKSKYPFKLITETLTKHQKMYINFTPMCNFCIEFRSKNNKIESISLSLPPKYDTKNDINS